ncbi:TonB-dependent receptor [Fulvivirga sp. RKSG066]|uniref:TonB-dependent receptor n=1 Tax=Fulvivirga aurantia TaxID=2529383 RepID=UPI0012BCBD75|nr:TonB-dependent receptor [Fulvivirga aurantia]MTI22871.1 TonB-dependent receptor [Fulvivirga aurantia]
MKRLSLFFAIILVSSAYTYGQNASISGRVSTTDGGVIPGAYVQLNSDLATVADEKGRYAFNKLTKGDFVITASFIGYQPLKKSVSINSGQSLVVNLSLDESVTQLNEVTVTGQSESMAIKEGIASVSLVEAKPFYNRSINAPDLLNTLSGVQVRQSGGVGNSTEISIQGLSGRQVKLFVDGIPMDFLLPVEELGIGASLSMFPVNLMERMEVYKGAVPVALGADALGGAINIITRKDFQDYLEISTEHSSFNTWRSTLSTRKFFDSGFTVGLSAFYMASDNNYMLDDVKTINEFGNPESISTPKFHDRFRSYMVKGEAGVVNKPWADQLLVSFSHGDLYDEIQHNFEMRQPYGQALNLATTYNTSLQYEKYDIADKLDLNFYLGYNRIATSFIDTTRNIYDWRGEIIGQKTYGGEITTSQNNLNLDGENLVGRLNVNYKITPTTSLIFNGVASHFTRVGSDPVAAEFYGEDYFQNPVYVDKLVAGVGLEKEFLAGKIVSHTAVKAYQFNSEGFIIENSESTTIKQDQFQPGFSQSFKWKANKYLLTKASYEYATRMPDRIETLGDFSAAINANPGLVPETSHNVNLGGLYKRKVWSIEVNSFLRRVSDIIILQAVPPPVLSKYENLLEASITGIESEVQYKPWHWLTVRANATYQDLRNRSNKINSGVSSDRYYGARLPNRPHLFGNGELQFSKSNVLKRGDQFQVWWSVAYVKEFFRYWEIDGRKEDKLTVPDQWLHNAGIAYTGWNERATLSLESQNILDANAYDNFRVQKPGRSWHVKLRLFLTKP